MNPTHRSAPFVLAALALLVACGSSVDGPDSDFPTEEAAARAAAFQITLKQELLAALSEGGPVRAVEVCKERAPAIAAESSDGTWRVRRIGTRVRNQDNTPDATDREALERLETSPDPVVLETEDGDGQTVQRFYQALRAGPLCLTCHGARETMEPELKERLAALYPDDGAVGYAAGDLRGAVVVSRILDGE